MFFSKIKTNLRRIRYNVIRAGFKFEVSHIWGGQLNGRDISLFLLLFFFRKEQQKEENTNTKKQIHLKKTAQNKCTKFLKNISTDNHNFDIPKLKVGSNPLHLKRVLHSWPNNLQKILNRFFTFWKKGSCLENSEHFGGLFPCPL